MTFRIRPPHLARKVSFPHGLKTKLSLGDFEGTTYHRRVSVSVTNGTRRGRSGWLMPEASNGPAFSSLPEDQTRSR